MLRAFEIIPDLLLRVFVPLLFAVGVGWGVLLLWQMVQGSCVNALGRFRRLPPVAKGLLGCFTNGVSLLPEARWGLLPHTEALSHGEGSVFRHAVTTNGSLLLDWHNALVGRDVNGPTNLQMELYRDGRFAWRTDDTSQFYLPVFPFDWDGDGLENSVDPEPLDACSDAHGTNAEWYDSVCSNVFMTTQTTQTTQTILPPGISFRTNVNDRAYYFAAVVAAQGPAPIYFNADRDSRLGSPVVVARAGETNHVPLLIGVEYMVTSTVPISVSVPDSMYASVTSNSTCSATVKWPLEFDFIEHIGVSNRTYTVTVAPFDPGGEFVWGGGAAGGGAVLMSTSPSSSCACYSGVGNALTFDCMSDCPCAGDCAAAGSYCFEAALFAVTGGVCRCGFQDPPHQEEPHHASTDGPGLSIDFSESAVVFEDAYEDAPGVMKPKRSTRVRLTVSAYGGPNGGTLTLSSQNLSNLSPMAGTLINLPSSRILAPGESFYTTCIYEAESASEGEGDVSVAGYFFENVIGEVFSDNASLTVVRLEVVPQVLFPQSCPNRHSFGVCEEIRIFCIPSSLSGFEWVSPGGVLAGGLTRSVQDFTYLLDEGQFNLTFSIGNVNYSVPTTCSRPTDIVCLESPLVLSGNVPLGEAGGIGMRMHLTILPRTVSFNGVRVIERVTEDGVSTGYFNQEYFSSWRNHQYIQGAGQLVAIDSENQVVDYAEMLDVCPKLENGGWESGSITWTIPCAWKEPSGFSISRSPVDYVTKQQRFLIDAIGTVQVEKFGCRAVRTAMGYVAVFTE